MALKVFLPSANGDYTELNRGFLDKPLLAVTGKGGVGKSAVAAALALRHARAGRRTLLFGVDSIQPLLRFFECPTESSQQVDVLPNLRCINLDRQLLLDEFIREKIGLKLVSDRIIQNPVYKYFSAVAPGIRELLALARIHQAVTAGWPGGTPWERVIIDAPATGHGVRFFAVPRIAINTFRVGPLKANSLRIKELLEDPRQTAFCLVTLAEEMPVSETLELYDHLVNQMAMRVEAVLVNAVYPVAASAVVDPDPAGAEPAGDPLYTRLLEAARFAQMRREMNERYINVLAQRIAVPLREIPYLADEQFGLAALDQLLAAIFDSPTPSSGVRG